MYLVYFITKFGENNIKILSYTFRPDVIIDLIKNKICELRVLLQGFGQGYY
jgi:hypothetical protein